MSANTGLPAMMKRETFAIANIYVPVKRRAGSRGPAVRCHCRHPNLVRAAPPICPDMIFGKDRTGNSGT
jgi:hypothetical protein